MSAPRPLRWVLDALEAARQAGILLARTRAVWLLGMLACLFAGLLWLGAQRFAPEVPGDEFFGIATYLVVVQFGLPFVMLFLGVTAVHGEIEDRTVAYLFIRPVARASLLLGKWLAVTVVGLALTLAVIGMTWLALVIPDVPWRRGVGPGSQVLSGFCRGSALAVAAYAAIGVGFATWFRRPLVLGAVFVVGFEFLGSAAPPQAGIRAATVADPVRRWLLQELAPTGQLREVLMSMNLEEQWLRDGLLGDPLLSLVRLTAIVLLLAVWIYSRREYDSKQRE